MFYLKINFIDLSLMANNSNCKTQTEDCNFSVFIEKSFRNFKKEERRDDANWSMGYLESNIHCNLYGKSEIISVKILLNLLSTVRSKGF